MMSDGDDLDVWHLVPGKSILLFIDGIEYPYTHYKNLGAEYGYSEYVMNENWVVDNRDGHALYAVEVRDSVRQEGLRAWFRQGEWKNDGGVLQLWVAERVA